MCVCAVIIHDKFIIHEIVTRTLSSIYRYLPIEIYADRKMWNLLHFKLGKLTHRAEDSRPQIKSSRETTVSFQSPVVAVCIQLNYYSTIFSESCIDLIELKTALEVIIVITVYCIIIRFTSTERRQTHETSIFHLYSVKRTKNKWRN